MASESRCRLFPPADPPLEVVDPVAATPVDTESVGVEDVWLSEGETAPSNAVEVTVDEDVVVDVGATSVLSVLLAIGVAVKDCDPVFSVDAGDEAGTSTNEAVGVCDFLISLCDFLVGAGWPIFDLLEDLLLIEESLV